VRAREAQRECIGAAVHDQDGHDGDDHGQQGELPDELEDLEPEVERGLALLERRLPQRSGVENVLDLISNCNSDQLVRCQQHGRIVSKSARLEHQFLREDSLLAIDHLKPWCKIKYRSKRVTSSRYNDIWPGGGVCVWGGGRDRMEFKLFCTAT
jgi:hypothetical protein